MRRGIHLVFAIGFVCAAGCSSQYAGQDTHEESGAPDSTGTQGVTGTPEANGSIVPNDPRGVWLAINPSQCSKSEPWRKAWFAANGNTGYAWGDGERFVIIDYCSSQGVSILDSATRHVEGASCSACTCRNHYFHFLLVSEEEAPAVAAIGGRPQRPDQ
jgi:hypothetical protein